MSNNVPNNSDTKFYYWEKIGDGYYAGDVTVMQNNGWQDGWEDYYRVTYNGSYNMLYDSSGVIVMRSEYYLQGWKVVYATEVSRDRLDIVFENFLTGNGMIWRTNGSATEISRTYYKTMDEVEEVINYDLDRDGNTGVRMTLIENDSDEGNRVRLYETSGDYYYIVTENGYHKLQGQDGSVVSVSAQQRAGWNLVHVSGDGYDGGERGRPQNGLNAVFEHVDGRAMLWKTDLNAKAISEKTYKDISVVEPLVGYDINDDGAIGYKLTLIKNTMPGDKVKLYKSSADIYIIDDGSGQKILKGFKGAPIAPSVYLKAGWELIHASSDGKGGFNLVSKHSGGRAIFWNADSNAKVTSEKFYKSLSTVELLLVCDLNDDGFIGYTIGDGQHVQFANDFEEGNNFLLGKTIDDMYIVGDECGQKILKGFNGAPIPPSAYLRAGWELIHASIDGKGGFNLASKHSDGRAIFWNTDSSAKVTSEKYYKSLSTVEILLGYDINDDGTIGYSSSDSKNFTLLSNDSEEGNKVKLYKTTDDMYVIDGGSGQKILQGYAGRISVAERTKAGWDLVHASSDGKGGYNIVWEHSGGSGRIWTTDANGKTKSDKIYKSIQDVEDVVGYDINDDGIIGNVIALENDFEEGNTVKLYKSTAGEYVVDDGSGMIALKTQGGMKVLVSDYAKLGWHIAHVSSNYDPGYKIAGKSGYNIAWEHTSGNTTIWKADASGVVRLTRAFKNMEEVEILLGYDIDDDGSVGYPALTRLENDANEGNTVNLYKSSLDHYSIDDGSRQIILKGFNGDTIPASAYLNAGWQLVHASSDSKGGFNLASEHSDGRTIFWNTDSNAKVTSEKFYDSVEDVEKIVGYDIDEDGDVGDTLTIIENDFEELNTVRLFKSSSSDTYIIIDGNSESTLQGYAGSVSVSERSKAGWKVLHASDDGNGGYNIAWQHSSGTGRMWKTDANGRAKMDVIYKSLGDVENVIGYDINDDGWIVNVRKFTGADDGSNEHENAFFVQDKSADTPPALPQEYYDNGFGNQDTMDLFL